MQTGDICLIQSNVNCWCVNIFSHFVSNSYLCTVSFGVSGHWCRD